MFNEKIVFLNKSTTKYAIFGTHSTTFKSTMRICDRSTGAYFSIDFDQYDIFLKQVKNLLNENFKIELDHEVSGFDAVLLENQDCNRNWYCRASSQFGEAD